MTSASARPAGDRHRAGRLQLYTDQIFAELRKSGSKAPPAAQTRRCRSQPRRQWRAWGKWERGQARSERRRIRCFLANDRTLADPEVIKVEPGGRVLLRIVNSSSMTAYYINLGPLDGELVAVDGFVVTPVKRRNDFGAMPSAISPKAPTGESVACEDGNCLTAVDSRLAIGIMFEPERTEGDPRE